MTLDWERDWPEAIDPETGEDPDGAVHTGWVNRPDWTTSGSSRFPHQIFPVPTARTPANRTKGLRDHPKPGT